MNGRHDADAMFDNYLWQCMLELVRWVETELKKKHLAGEALTKIETEILERSSKILEM